MNKDSINTFYQSLQDRTPSEKYGFLNALLSYDKENQEYNDDLLQVYQQLIEQKKPIPACSFAFLPETTKEKINTIIDTLYTGSVPAKIQLKNNMGILVDPTYLADKNSDNRLAALKAFQPKKLGEYCDKYNINIKQFIDMLIALMKDNYDEIRGTATKKTDQIPVEAF
jgi:hypothetical protein